MKLGLRAKIVFGFILIFTCTILYTFYGVSKLNSINMLLEADGLQNNQAYLVVDAFAKNLIVFNVFLVIVGLFIGLFFANWLTKPVLTIKEVIAKLSMGEIPKIDLSDSANDEIGDINRSLLKYLESLKSTAQFAVLIGKGELDATYTPLSQNDILGHALLDMRSNLQEQAVKDENRNMIVFCNAEVSNILRSHTVLENLGDDLLKYLCQKVRAVQGAFYVVDEDEKGLPTLFLLNLYAYNKKKSAQKRFRFGEGLVGQAAIEKDIVHRTEIPSHYVSITSGLLEEKKPNSIFLIPLIANEKVYGVLEFASVYTFTTLEIEILQDVSEIIAQTIFNLQVNVRTNRLLEESQRMSSELKEQSAILQQNAEEMQATQEELKRSNAKLEEQIEEVNKSQRRTQALLENSSEVILICNKDMLISYASPSVTNILGYSTEELLGSLEKDRIHPGDVQAFQTTFDRLLLKPRESTTLQYQYLKKTGEYIWLEVTGKNLLIEPAIKGIVFNLRDITERKNAEKESRMRSQMQSLSENSPDLICRLNLEGKFFYVNPTIEKLTHKHKDEYLQKPLQETALENSVKESWLQLIHQVVGQEDKVQIEIPFPTPDGTLVMNVNAIPEFNESKVIESILLVSNDITERKKAELEIQTQNRKITESINYAQRIQAAILPDLSKIKKLLPHYFMLYKPRDVVSGDFPWFVQSGDDLYLAVVDCTGHGVPGAMLSLIGYFLLNDIVKSQKITQPGMILDILDASVTKTLKQDVEGNEMKDGMDISLCKINLKKNTLEYAGAHRPLYHLRAGELMEYKGNKFAVGGGIFKNQTQFTNYEIMIQPHDSFYFLSDGYPDQFGGPENKKIGPARVKELIIANANIPKFESLKEVFDSFFTNWKANGKQMDDVLLMGMKF